MKNMRDHYIFISAKTHAIFNKSSLLLNAWPCMKFRAFTSCPILPASKCCWHRSHALYRTSMFQQWHGWSGCQCNWRCTPLQNVLFCPLCHHGFMPYLHSWWSKIRKKEVSMRILCFMEALTKVSKIHIANAAQIYCVVWEQHFLSRYVHYIPQYWIILVKTNT